MVEMPWNGFHLLLMLCFVSVFRKGCFTHQYFNIDALPFSGCTLLDFYMYDKLHFIEPKSQQIFLLFLLATCHSNTDVNYWTKISYNSLYEWIQFKENYDFWVRITFIYYIFSLSHITSHSFLVFQYFPASTPYRT